MNPQTAPGDTFLFFPSLPSELRYTIWRYCLWSQNRVVGLSAQSHCIDYASCLTLFLVCQESLYVAARAYRKLQRGEITCDRVYPLPSPIRGPLVSFETDIFHIRIPMMVEKFWGAKIWTAKMRRALDPTSNVPISQPERDIDRFIATPVIKRIGLLVDFNIDDYSLILLALRLSGDHRDNAGERLRSELYRWLREVEEVYIPNRGGRGIYLAMAGDVVDEQRSMKPDFDEVLRGTLAFMLEDMP